jgi:hypothetical protein
MQEGRERVRDIFEVRVREDKLGEVLRGFAGRIGLLELWVKGKDERKSGKVEKEDSCQIE